VSNPENIREGTLTAICANNHKFTITVKSYRACRETKEGRKNGCPECKKIKTNEFWKGRVRKEPQETSALSKGIKKKKILKPMFIGITNRETLIFYLKNNFNDYNFFILQKLEEEESVILKKREFPEIVVQYHHIIPLHAGRPDEKWDLVLLELNEHIIAHRLRFKVYKEDGDERYLRFVDKINTNYFPREVHINQISPIVQKKLQEGTVWVHPNYRYVLTIPPNAVELPSELYDFFLQSLPVDSLVYQDLLLTNKTAFSKGISRVLTGKGKAVRKWKLAE
jgi:RNA polymerase subunit RPABC4/transcription elongation factor Spt4